MDADLSKLNKAIESLSNIIDEIKGYDFKVERGQQVLMREKNSIIRHFSRMNYEYCPRMMEDAKNSPSLSASLDYFWKDMQAMTAELNEFFHTFQEVEHSIRFSRAVGGLYARLLHSVQKQQVIAEMFEAVMHQQSSASRELARRSA